MDLLGLPAARQRGQVFVGKGFQALMRPGLGAPVLVRQQIAGGAIEQRARVRNGFAGAPDRQKAGIDLLHQIGRGLAVVQVPGAEVQQFSVVVDGHGSTGGNGFVDRLASIGESAVRSARDRMPDSE